jgi:3-phenylpropionate/trans-cinnamate dioxygenase ferredoxin subunit
MADQWIDAGAPEDIDPEDVIRFDHDGRTFAVYRTEDDRYFATDGLCTHEKVECPKHNGRFDFTTGKAKGAPVCVDITTYPVKVDGGRLLINLG